jgi:glycosyltransferase involved in cell wall biosynthesis
LLEAWEHLGARLPLKVAGDGPLLAEVQRRAALVPGVEVLGRQNAVQVRTLMSGATLLAIPSEWYEGFPMTLLEAYALGLPVVASNIGALASLVQDGVTGQHFRPGDAAHLAQVVGDLLDDPARLARLRPACRDTFLNHYTAEINVQQQLEIYRQALAQRRGEQVQPVEALGMSAD